jgi:predicted nucleic acid-binding protein
VSVFLDTSGLFAALVANDQAHADARAVMERLLDRSTPLLSSGAVVLETMALLHARVGRSAALDFDRVLLPSVELVWVDAALHARAVRRLAAGRGRTPSLVDCISFELMEQRGLHLAFAFDADFEAAGFELLRRGSDVDRALGD